MALSRPIRPECRYQVVEFFEGNGLIPAAELLEKRGISVQLVAGRRLRKPGSGRKAINEGGDIGAGDFSDHAQCIACPDKFLNTGDIDLRHG